MASHLKLYLFGDQTFEIQPHLKTLFQKRDNLFLQDFLNKGYHAIRVELFKVPYSIRKDLPRFTCLEDLLLWDQSGQRCVALDMAMTTLYQLATFISQAGISSYDAQNTRVVGLCTGAFAAAAISCSSFTADLIPMAVSAVIASFRTGLLVTDTARRVDSSQDQSWALLVPGQKATAAIEEYCDQNDLPLTSRPYISAYAPNGITVSGPPKRLSDLTQWLSSKSITSKSIPIFGAYHAPHLYSQKDARRIIASLMLNEATALSEQIPVLSSTGIKPEERSFVTLLEDSIAQVLLRPLRWSAIFEGVQTSLEDASAEQFSIAPIGTTAEHLIYTALKKTSLRSLVPDTTPSQKIKLENIPDSGTSKPKLAIVAMSGRFPGAKDNEAYWDLLYKGLDVHKPVPSLRWDQKTHVDPTGQAKNTGATPFGCWLDDPASFDARFFNISPREAPQVDPAQRLALMTAYEAIEQAGIVPDATPSTRPDRVGVFYGVTSNDWMETNSAQNIDTYFIPGGNRAFIPGRINYFFKFSGPSYAVDTACSSSLAGIHLACNALWQNDVDTAIAGGTNVLTNPDYHAGLDRGHFLSRTGNCKTFDDGADGYCRGEGIATIIMKRLDDALAENDPILGVVLGAYTNHSAESESITRPHVGAQRVIFNKILNEAAVDPYSIGYVEMHGTGTQAGDATEMSSVLETFAPPATSKAVRTKDQRLFIGSAKSNIGHGEAASGVCSVIKVLQMMKKNTIVPHCGIKTKINHRFPTDFEERGVRIAFEPTPWEKLSVDMPRRVMVNNFSAAGGNSALLVEDAPLKKELVGGKDSRVQFPIAFTAKSGVSLQGNMRSMLKFLGENPDVSLPELSYTTTARRIHHQHRLLISGSSPSEICGKIETALQNNTGVNRPKAAPKVVFSFTGQGAQYPGMGKQLFEENPFVRKELLQLDQIGQNLGFPSTIPFVESEEQDVAKFAPSLVQLASVSLQITLSKLWASWGIVPSAVVGHSLGEYAALNVAGVLSDTDTLFLVGGRAQLLETKCSRGTHAMLVVKGSQDEISEALEGEEYETACINSPVETVLAGPNDQIAKVKEILSAASFKTTLLKVPYAFHSSQLEPMVGDIEDLANKVTFSEPTIPVLCPLDGTVVENGDAFSASYLAKHSRQPVNMLSALTTAYRDGAISDRHMMLEVGPHPAVTGMVKPTLGQQMTCIASLQRGRAPWEMLSAALKTLYNAGSIINWADYQSSFPGSHSVVAVPAYSWDLKEYWIKYVNDWSLRKGDPPLVISNSPKLESTTIHNVVEESGDSSKTHIIVEADIARKDLSPLVQGHEVDGIPLCTPSVYADIGLTLGKYLFEKYQPQNKDNMVVVSDMDIKKALILRGDGSKQPIQAHAEADWLSNSVAIKFMSFDAKGNLHEHSTCVVRFQDRSHQQSLQSEASTTFQKMQNLRSQITTGESARFNRPMAYRMIRPLARFHDDYRAIDEVVLNSTTLEASSKISFGTVKRDGDFHTHPAVIDALTQSCGFAMNCNDNTDIDVDVYMNHGWGSLELFEELDFEKEYTTYTQMFEGEDKLWYGDVVIFDGDRVVAFFGQIAIQGVPRRVLKVILSIESGKKGQPQRQVQAKPQSTPSNTSASPAKPAQNKSSAKMVTTKFSTAIRIISEESGIEIADFTDGTTFSDVGIDSLLGLTISARFQEELDIDLDFNALFFEHPTVKDLRDFLQGPEEDVSGSSSSAASDSGRETNTSGTATPELREEFVKTIDVEFERALEIISEESGVARTDLDDDTNFADCGVDSLLSLVIASRFQDVFDLDVRHEQLFMECQTVADLRTMLAKELGLAETAPAKSKPADVPAPVVSEAVAEETAVVHSDITTLASREKAITELVQKYTAGFSAPTSTPSGPALGKNESVVLVTGASGGLGSHLVYAIAQLEEVRTVVCLNRQNREDPETRQYKAMRDKGIRFPEHLKSKLRIFQADTSKPKLGLQDSDYDSMVKDVTHIIHNAWPMSAKRPLSGFESQFQVSRNLLDLGHACASSRPEDFKFSFQMVSSIGVVGQWGLAAGQTGKIIVPEQRATIDSLLGNGYAEAKWGCERMLDETLHKYPNRFRPMVVRLGQIAGSKTSGYWNPMEHFGFLIKSSQTLNALPDVDGNLNWTPVNDIADTLTDLVLSDRTPHPIYHIDNPVGQQWRDVNNILSDTLRIPNLVPFKQWLDLVRKAPQQDNPAALLADFLEDTYLRMACGGLVLDVKNTLEHSKSLAAVGPVSETVVRKYIHIWKEIGFLKTTAEDKAGFEAERMRLWGPRV